MWNRFRRSFFWESNENTCVEVSRLEQLGVPPFLQKVATNPLPFIFRILLRNQPVGYSDSCFELPLFNGSLQRPKGVPLARQGPFVMNTQQEVMQAFADDRRGGTFGSEWIFPTACDCEDIFKLSNLGENLQSFKKGNNRWQYLKIEKL